MLDFNANGFTFVLSGARRASNELSALSRAVPLIKCANVVMMFGNTGD